MNDKRPAITVALLDKLKSPKGGFSRASLAVLGISWPPKRGWHKDLIRQARANEIVAQAAQPEVDVYGHASVIKLRFLLLNPAERESLLAELLETYKPS